MNTKNSATTPYAAGTSVSAAVPIGAVDLAACPQRDKRGRRNTGRKRLASCSCGKCKVCGFPLHSGIHAPLLGEAPGGKPWGHKFVPPSD